MLMKVYYKKLLNYLDFYIKIYIIDIYLYFIGKLGKSKTNIYLLVDDFKLNNKIFIDLKKPYDGLNIENNLLKNIRQNASKIHKLY